MQAYAGNGANSLAGRGISKIRLELFDVFWEGISSCGCVTAQSPHCGLVRAGRAAEAEINAARVERGERSELLCDDKRRMVGQHDAAGADTDGFCTASDVADNDRRGSAGDAGHVVVLSEPETVVAQSLRVLRQIERVAERVRGGRALRNRREIQDRKGNHTHWMLYLVRTLRSEILDRTF